MELRKCFWLSMCALSTTLLHTVVCALLLPLRRQATRQLGLGESISSATSAGCDRERERAKSDLTFALRCINNDAAADDDDAAVGAENWVENCT